jgi:hypothetical protein
LRQAAGEVQVMQVDNEESKGDADGKKIVEKVNYEMIV